MAETLELIGWRCQHMDMAGPYLPAKPPLACGCTPDQLEPVYELPDDGTSEDD